MAAFNADFIETVHAYGPALRAGGDSRELSNLTPRRIDFALRLSLHRESVIDISYITNEMHISFFSIIIFDHRDSNCNGSPERERLNLT